MIQTHLAAPKEYQMNIREVVINEAADFSGTNGYYLYQGRDIQERKNKRLKDQILVVAPSEGLA